MIPLDVDIGCEKIEVCSKIFEIYNRTHPYTIELMVGGDPEIEWTGKFNVNPHTVYDGVIVNAHEIKLDLTYDDLVAVNASTREIIPDMKFDVNNTDMILYHVNIDN